MMRMHVKLHVKWSLSPTIRGVKPRFGNFRLSLFESKCLVSKCLAGACLHQNLETVPEVFRVNKGG